MYLVLASTLVVTGVALLASAQFSPHNAYISEICMPLNTSGYPDMDAPCNEVVAIELQCLYGPDPGLAAFYSAFSNGSQSSSTSSSNPVDVDDHQQAQTHEEASAMPAQQSNATQQVCICESQFWNMLDGCTTCQRRHGSSDIVNFLGHGYIAHMSSAYCAASATPSLDFTNFLASYVNPVSLPASIKTAAHAVSTRPFSDPLTHRTAVSDYFTPSVTGSVAWIVAEQSGTAGTSGPGTFAVANTVSGQIVPTGTTGGPDATGGASGGGKPSTGAARVARGKTNMHRLLFFWALVLTCRMHHSVRRMGRRHV